MLHGYKKSVLLFTAIAITFFFNAFTSAQSSSPSPTNATPVYGYKIITAYPHDTNSFTQGLIYKDNFLYESTGGYGKSSLRRIDLSSGQLSGFHRLPPQLFGEGIDCYENKIIQLTWKSKIGFIYDKNTFKSLGTFEYATQGWGVTNDGEKVIMSDGSSTLYFLEPNLFTEIGRIHVYDTSGPVSNLNELEYVHGEIYANIWKTDKIARIDPDTGRITGWIDLTGLLGKTNPKKPKAGVLNGIAYDLENNRLFVTGKLWPRLFEIKLIPR